MHFSLGKQPSRRQKIKVRILQRPAGLSVPTASRPTSSEASKTSPGRSWPSNSQTDGGREDRRKERTKRGGTDGDLLSECQSVQLTDPESKLRLQTKLPQQHIPSQPLCELRAKSRLNLTERLVWEIQRHQKQNNLEGENRIGASDRIIVPIGQSLQSSNSL